MTAIGLPCPARRIDLQNSVFPHDVTMGEKTRLTIDLDPQLHRELKILAASKGTTMRDLCILALKQHLAIGKGIGPDPVLDELWNNEEDAFYDDL